MSRKLFFKIRKAGPAFPQNATSSAAHVWDIPSREDRYIQLRISRNTSIAFLFSILLHLLLLITFAPKLLTIGDPESDASETMIVSLAPSAAEPPPPAPPAETIIAEPVPAPPPKPPRPKPAQPKPQPDASTNRIIALEKPAPDSIPLDSLDKPLDTRIPPRPTPPPVEEAHVDMLAYVNAQRAHRQAAQGYTPRDSAEIAARDNPISEDDRRSAVIKRNLQMEGTNGIFQIREIGSSHARFSFLGWKNFSNARQELVDVEVGPEGDIQRAVVKKMIEIIRRDYKGDFNWESQRLGRTIILSARLEDNAGLEDFLITEFFGVAGIRAR